MTKFNQLKNDMITLRNDFFESGDDADYFEYMIALARLEGFVEAGTISTAEKIEYAALVKTA